MQFAHLLAKSCPDPENPPFEATLAGHTIAVIESFRALFGSVDQPTRLAGCWLNFFRLSQNDFSIFFLNCLAACLFHDLGKANGGFQKMIRRKGRQQLRHEHLSTILIFSAEIKNWIATVTGLDERVIVSSVLGHHLKAAPRNRNFAQYLEGVAQTRFSLDTSLLADILRIVSGAVPELGGSPEHLELPEIWDLGRSGGAGTDLKEQAEQLLKEFDRNLKKKQ